MTAITLTSVQATIKAELARATKAFTKQPNAFNWIATQRAMLVHQQAQSAFAHRTADELCAKLADLPMGDWPDAIVVHTTNQTITQALG
jgi:hypothetical protein